MGEIITLVRKLLIVFLLLITALFNFVYADEVYKIKGVSFDTSGSSIFLNTIGNYQSSITDSIKPVTLPESHKVYFDINSSILIGKKQDLYLTSGVVKQIKISQFTTNPNVVRVVMIFDDNYNLDN